MLLSDSAGRSLLRFLYAPVFDFPVEEETISITGLSAARTNVCNLLFLDCSLSLVLMTTVHTYASFQIDLDVVAEALGYKNPRSVGNRLAVLKKVHGLGLITAVLKKVHGLGLITTVANAGKEASSAVAGSPTNPSKVTKSPRVACKPRMRKTAGKIKFSKDDDDVMDEGDDTVGGNEEDIKPARLPRGRTFSSATKPKSLSNQLSKERVSESDDADQEHVSPVGTGADKGDESRTQARKLRPRWQGSFVRGGRKPYQPVQSHQVPAGGSQAPHEKDGRKD